MFSIPLCRYVILKVEGCFFHFLVNIYSFRWGTRFPWTYIVSRNGGGGRCCFLFDCLFVLLFYIFPFSPLKKNGFGCLSPQSLNLLTEMVHPLEVFQDFFSKWTYLSFLLYPKADLKMQYKEWSAICGSKKDFWSDLKKQY